MLTVLLLDQLSAAGGSQHADLLNVVSQIQHVRSDFLFKINEMLFQFLNFDEHSGTPRAADVLPRRPRKHTLKSNLCRKQSSRIKGVEKGVKERGPSRVAQF